MSFTSCALICCQLALPTTDPVKVTTESLRPFDGIVKLSRIRRTDPQDDGLESRREPGMLGVDHRDSA